LTLSEFAHVAKLLSCERKTDDSFHAKQTSADAGISAFPDGDNIFSWVGTIEGAAGTVSVTNQPRVVFVIKIETPQWTDVVALALHH